MASITRREGKGKTSYQITVSQGADVSGKQIRKRMTWTPPAKMTERQAQKEVQRIAFEFEQQVQLGFAPDSRQTFAEYADYVLELKVRNGLKPTTEARYRDLLKRINHAIGHMKLRDIRPQHLNDFYASLQKSGVRNSSQSATPKSCMFKRFRATGKSIEGFAREAGTAPTNLRAVLNGDTVSMAVANAISEALGYKTEQLFSLSKDSRPLSSKTIIEYHRLISSILRMAEKEMLVPYNAAEKATPPRNDRSEAECFQPNEILEILDCLQDEPIRWRTITHMLIITGCRRGEIMGLHWNDIDWDNNQICVRHNLLYTAKTGIYEDSTKTRTTRYVKLPLESMQVLRAYKAWYEELRDTMGDRWQNTPYVFVRDNGTALSPDSISGWLKGFEERHGLVDVHAHKFRHSMASILINQGTDIVAVSKRLGHATVSTTTDIYSHIIKEADAKSAECIADAYLRRPTKAM